MKLMYTCREMVDLISQELDHDHTISTQMKMKMHIVMCKKCRIYRDQLFSVDTFLQNHFASLEPSSEALVLTDEARDRISKAIQEM